MLRMILLSLLMFAAPAMAADVLDVKVLAALPNLANPAPNLATAGAVQAKDVADIARAGIKHVINLRLDSETPDFDEAAAVRAAGMAYHNLPIRNAGDLTLDNAARFDRLINDTGGDPTLVHCTSSNRVGALAALRAAWIQGQPVEAALAEGRRWGLKGMEPAVRERLTASGASSKTSMPAVDVVHRLLIDAHEGETTATGINRHHLVAEVRDDVRVSLSAMTKLVELQAAGYGLIP